MKVILLESVTKLGELGDAVEVKPGYARNFLIPQRKAVRATSEAIAAVESRRAELVKEEKERLDVAKARAQNAVKSLTLSRRVIDEEGRLFGSVTANDIVESANEHDTEILRSEILMPEGNIKNTGDYVIPVTVHPEVSFEVTVSVIPDSLVPSLEETMDAADQVQAASETESDDSDTNAGQADSSADKAPSE